MSRPDADYNIYHAELIAYWGPLLHLLVFGLGWRRPDLGLERWQQRGQPTGHPILAVVNRWWGPYVPDVLAWAAGSDYLASAGQVLPGSDGPPDRGKVDRSWREARRDDPKWQRRWSSGDPLHLTTHARAPAEPDAQTSSHLFTDSEASATAVLVCDTYNGWHHALSSCGLTQTPQGASWKVDVVVKPLGWLGTYRLSHATGAWFSGMHRWHQLGW